MSDAWLRPSTNWWRVVAVVVAALLCTATIGYIRERATSRDLAESEADYRADYLTAVERYQSLEAGLQDTETNLRRSADEVAGARESLEGDIGDAAELRELLGDGADLFVGIDNLLDSIGSGLDRLADELQLLRSSSQP